MNTPQPGDFFLAPISGLGGAAIKAGEWLNGDGFLTVQHAGIYLGQGLTIEAMPGGAIQGDIGQYDPASLVWSSGTIEFTIPATRQLVCDAAKKYIGVPYSGLDYLAIAAHRMHLPTPGLKEYIASTKHMICSQLVDQVYLDAGVHLFSDGRWPGYVTPGSLYALLGDHKFPGKDF
jgi:cell wall-associated NlpC family hydrolase